MDTSRAYKLLNPVENVNREFKFHEKFSKLTLSHKKKPSINKHQKEQDNATIANKIDEVKKINNDHLFMTDDEDEIPPNQQPLVQNKILDTQSDENLKKHLAQSASSSKEPQLGVVSTDDSMFSITRPLNTDNRQSSQSLFSSASQASSNLNFLKNPISEIQDAASIRKISSQMSCLGLDDNKHFQDNSVSLNLHIDDSDDTDEGEIYISASKLRRSDVRSERSFIDEIKKTDPNNDSIFTISSSESTQNSLEESLPNENVEIEESVNTTNDESEIVIVLDSDEDDDSVADKNDNENVMNDSNNLVEKKLLSNEDDYYRVSGSDDKNASISNTLVTKLNNFFDNIPPLQLSKADNIDARKSMSEELLDKSNANVSEKSNICISETSVESVESLEINKDADAEKLQALTSTESISVKTPILSENVQSQKSNAKSTQSSESCGSKVERINISAKIKINIQISSLNSSSDSNDTSQSSSDDKNQKKSNFKTIVKRQYHVSRSNTPTPKTKSQKTPTTTKKETPKTQSKVTPKINMPSTSKANTPSVKTSANKLINTVLSKSETLTRDTPNKSSAKKSPAVKSKALIKNSCKKSPCNIKTPQSSKKCQPEKEIIIKEIYDDLPVEADEDEASELRGIVEQMYGTDVCTTLFGDSKTTSTQKKSNPNDTTWDPNFTAFHENIRCNLESTRLIPKDVPVSKSTLIKKPETAIQSPLVKARSTRTRTVKPKKIEICDTDTSDEEVLNSDDDFQDTGSSWSGTADESESETENDVFKTPTVKPEKKRLLFVPANKVPLEVDVDGLSKKFLNVLDSCEFKKRPAIPATPISEKIPSSPKPLPSTRRKLFNRRNLLDDINDIIPNEDGDLNKENDKNSCNDDIVPLTMPIPKFLLPPINKKIETIKKMEVQPKTPAGSAEKKLETKKASLSVKVKPVKPETPRSIKKIPEPIDASPRTYSFLQSFDVSLCKDLCDQMALFYRDTYKTNKEKLTEKLYNLYNEKVFNNELNISITWNKKLLNTAGRCNNVKKQGIRISRIELSDKVLTSPDRLRCTLIHELCHAATWVFNGENGHGATWKSWAAKANQIFPELPKISVCHQYDIEYKYTYKCTKCSSKYNAHSRSKKVENIRCAMCHGAIEIFLNKKGKDGTVVSTPTRKASGFAKFVSEKYKLFKRPELKHADVMKLLSTAFSSLSVEEKVKY